MVDSVWIMGLDRDASRVLWRRPRLFLESRRVPSVRCNSKSIHLQQHVSAHDASAHFPLPLAWHQQLCQRVGEALAAPVFRGFAVCLTNINCRFCTLSGLPGKPKACQLPTMWSFLYRLMDSRDIRFMVSSRSQDTKRWLRCEMQSSLVSI